MMNTFGDRANDKRILTICFLGLAVIQCIFQAGLLTQGVEFIQTSLTHDDTFYYLQTAWNVKELGFATFDGLHKTNGVQMLWFGVVVGLAFLSPTKIFLLYLASGVFFACTVACYGLIWKIGKLLNASSSVFILGIFWLLQNIWSAQLYRTVGMENALHALVFWGLLWQVLLFIQAIQRQKRLNWAGLTALCILNAWSRLDAAIYSVLLFGLCVGWLAYITRSLPCFVQQHGKPLTLSAIAAVVGSGFQFMMFWIMGNSYVPVSGLIKSGELHWGWDPGFRRELVQALYMSVPSVLGDLVPPDIISRSGFYGTTAISLLILIGLHLIRSYYIRSEILFRFQKFWNTALILFFLICCLSTSGQYNPLAAYVGLCFSLIVLAQTLHYSKELKLIQMVWSFLCIAFISYHIMIVLSRVSYHSHYTWYRSPVYIFWLVTVLFVYALFEHLVASMGWPQRIFRSVIIGATIAYLMLSSYYHGSLGLPGKLLFKIRYQAAIWLSEYIPEQAVVASWNAGQLGYFSNRTLINLDGLVNSIEYYRDVKQGHVPLLDYLYENNVTYIVDYCCVEELLPHLRHVQSFPPHLIEWWEEPVRIEQLHIWELLPK